MTKLSFLNKCFEFDSYRIGTSKVNTKKPASVRLCDLFKCVSVKRIGGRSAKTQSWGSGLNESGSVRKSPR